MVAHGHQQHRADGGASQFAADADALLLRLGVAGHLAQCPQHGGMEIPVQLRHPGVVAVHGQHVLGEIVGADGKEVHPPCQFPRLVHGGRHFHHHTDQGILDFESLLGHFAMGLADQPLRLLHLGHARHHGQHDAQHALEAGVGLEHGAGLGQEDLRVVQGDANAAPAEKGIVLGDGEVGQRLVAAHIQGAHGHWTRFECLHVGSIEAPLLLLGGKAVLGHEGHFGAEQTDALRAPVQGAGDVAGQADVHPQQHPVAVEGDAGQAAQFA